MRRSYSICAEPRSFADGSSEIRVAIKKDLGGLFSTWANAELKAGDVLDVMSPMGAFVSKHGRDGKPVEQNVMNSMNHPEDLAGEPGIVRRDRGRSGITPVIAIARTLLAAHPDTRFDLIYANKAAMDVMFLEELADLKDKYPARLALHHVLSREQRIAPLLQRPDRRREAAGAAGHRIHADDVDEWFLCGPFELVQLCRDTLAERGVKPEHVRFELFTSGKPDRPEGNIGRPVIADESEGDVQDHLQARRPAGRGRQPHPRPRIHPQRRPAGPPRRAVRVRRRSLRHLPRQGGHRHRRRWTRTTRWSRTNWTRATC